MRWHSVWFVTKLFIGPTGMPEVVEAWTYDGTTVLSPHPLVVCRIIVLVHGLDIFSPSFLTRTTTKAEAGGCTQLIATTGLISYAGLLCLIWGKET